MIPKYVVFNTNKLDKHGKALPVVQGDDLTELQKAFPGTAYAIKPTTDREEW